jgi:hypothetical protein
MVRHNFNRLLYIVFFCSLRTLKRVNFVKIHQIRNSTVCQILKKGHQLHVYIEPLNHDNVNPI